jgi:sugar lactone lactonase YvrE
MRPHLLFLAASALSSFVLALPAAAGEHPFPDVIHLPDGFHPEGIARGEGNTLYVAEFDTGAVFRADARTGTGSVLVPAQAGRHGLGIKLDRGSDLLYVCGGPAGHAYVYAAATGANVADFTLATGTTFINDVVLTERAAYFTDSSQPVLYKLPLAHGRPGGAIETLALSGQVDFDTTPGAFNGNGIVATHDGKQLIVVNSATGHLSLVDAATGNAQVIPLDGVKADVVNGDGLVLRGHTLYVVENFTNRIDVVELGPHFDRGDIVEIITDPRFDVPATAALLGDALYVTNARFTTPVTSTTPYTVVRVELQD